LQNKLFYSPQVSKITKIFKDICLTDQLLKTGHIKKINPGLHWSLVWNQSWPCPEATRIILWFYDKKKLERFFLWMHN